MHNKIYERIKHFIVNSYKFILFLIISFFIMTYELPYYIDTPGGLINLNEKIEVKNSYESKGSINLTYVLELKATLPTLIVSKFKPDWSVIKKEEVIASSEVEKDVIFRDKMLLEEANDNALIVSFNKANKEFKIMESRIYVTYMDDDANTNLEIGDEILEVNGNKVNSKKHLLNEISKHKANDVLNIKVVNNNQYSNKNAVLKQEDGRVIVGILITEDKKIETEPQVNFNFSGNESGPSGGLMETLHIYNSLVKEDITKGLTIVGTGTIDEDGNVGSIGGVEFKLKGAVKKDADIFFVPNGENYEEAIKIKERFSYDIKIIGVDTFDDALNYLNNI